MTVLVTGAGGGIGTAIVHALSRRGENVIAHDLTLQSLQHLQHPEVEHLEGDLLRLDSIESLRAQLQDHELDAVIAAHGIDGSGGLARLEPAFVRKVLEVNAETVPKLMALTESRLVGGGRFVVVASQAGLRGEPHNAAYCASKFAAVAWVRAIAPMMRAQGIHVRALCPGCTETPLLIAAHDRFAAEHGLDPETFLGERRAKIPIQRFASSDETAAAAVYLAARGDRPTVLAATGGEVPF